MPAFGNKTNKLCSKIKRCLNPDESTLAEDEFGCVVVDDEQGLQFVIDMNGNELDDDDQDHNSFMDKKEFQKQWNDLSKTEHEQVLSLDVQDVLDQASQEVQCLGCRRSVESMCAQLCGSSDKHAFKNLEFSSTGRVTYCKKCDTTADSVYPWLCHNRTKKVQHRKNRRCVFHQMDSQRMLPLDTWQDLWDQLSSDCKKEVTVVDRDLFDEALDSFISKHRFCVDCKTKVQVAFDILLGLIDGEGEAGYNSKLYSGISHCKNHCHINVSCDRGVVPMLIVQATEDFVDGERHATTVEQAQREVLLCLGEVLFDRLQNLWLRVRTVEETYRTVRQLLRTSFAASLQTVQQTKNGDHLFLELLEDENSKKKRKGKKKKTTRKELDLVKNDNSINIDDETEQRLLTSFGWTGSATEVIKAGLDKIDHNLQQERDHLRQVLQENFKKYTQSA